MYVCIYLSARTYYFTPRRLALTRSKTLRAARHIPQPLGPGERALSGDASPLHATRLLND